ncbi:MAG: hypothetical protein KJ070_18915 [Verrucomicrobia bacterium]|nr:hypothetical protein [Verrucomicrobiota bacterium]
MNLPKSTSAAATVIGGLLLCIASNVNAASWRGDILVAQASAVSTPSVGKYAAAPKSRGKLKRCHRVTLDFEERQPGEHATVQKT